MSHQECKLRRKIVNASSDETTFYPYSVKINKCSDSVMLLMIHMQKCVFLILLKT